MNRDLRKLVKLREKLNRREVEDKQFRHFIHPVCPVYVQILGGITVVDLAPERINR